MNHDPIEFARTPPHSIEAEQSVLGALLLDNTAFDRIGAEIQEQDFYRYDHRVVFEHIVKLIMANAPADVITVYESLAANAKAEEVGGLSYLNALAQNTPSAANIKHYAGIVRANSIRRLAISALDEGAAELWNAAKQPSALIDSISTKLDALCRTAEKSEPKRVGDSLMPLVEAMDRRYNGDEPLGLSTGFIDIDKQLNGGLRRGDLVIVAARPKMGKSALTQNIAQNVAKGGGSALILNLEMTEEQLNQRNIASVGRIHLNHVTDAKQMTAEDWPRLTQAIADLRALNLFFDCQPGMSLQDVRSKAKLIKRKHGLDLLVVDYLQLMSGEGDNRNAQIEGITRGLKTLAKELDIALVLLSQLNREVERRPNKRPMPSDLRDSGSIEQDCDICAFLYRDEVYNRDSNDKGMCEVNFSLMRQGKPGIVGLAYIGEEVRFGDAYHGWMPTTQKKPGKQERYAGGFDD